MADFLFLLKGQYKLSTSVNHCITESAHSCKFSLLLCVLFSLDHLLLKTLSFKSITHINNALKMKHHGDKSNVFCFCANTQL